jgi:hypothetical protein
MIANHVNHASLTALRVLSTTALCLVLYGSTQPPQPDEGTAAHLFQLSGLIFVVAFFAYLATAEWNRPLEHVRRLALPVTVLAVAMALLLYLESVTWTAG